MGQAIGDLLPYAVGVAVSPLPIMAIILMLLSSRAGANSASFLIGWVIGVAGASAALLAISGSLHPGSAQSPSTNSSVIKLVAGVLLLLLAGRNFRKRTPSGETAELPKWLAGIDSLTPPKAAGLGVLLSALNPKNLLLTAGAMVAVSQSHLAVGDEVIVVAVFVVIAVSTVAAPVIVLAVAGQRARPMLDSMRVWLGENNATVMAVLLLVIGVVLVGKAIGGFSGS